MIRRILGIGFAGALLASAAWAGPMGPVRPVQGQSSVEVEAYSDRREMQWTGNTADVSRAEVVGILSRLAYGLTDEIEVYVRLGNADLEDADKSDVTAASIGTFNGSSEFAGGLGFSAIVHDAGDWNLAFTANFLAHDNHTGQWGTFSDNNIDYREWNVGLQGQWKRKAPFLPYIGVKWSDAYVGYDRFGGAPTLDDRASRNLGVYAGSGFDFSPRFSGYLEGRFFDETSFGGGIRYAF